MIPSFCHGVSILTIIHQISLKNLYISSIWFSNSTQLNSTQLNLERITTTTRPNSVLTHPSPQPKPPFSVIPTRPKGLCFFHPIFLTFSSSSNTTSLFIQVSVLVCVTPNTRLQQLGSSKLCYSELRITTYPLPLIHSFTSIQVQTSPLLKPKAGRATIMQTQAHSLQFDSSYSFTSIQVQTTPLLKP